MELRGRSGSDGYWTRSEIVSWSSSSRKLWEIMSILPLRAKVEVRSVRASVVLWAVHANVLVRAVHPRRCGKRVFHTIIILLRVHITVVNPLLTNPTPS